MINIMKMTSVLEIAILYCLLPHFTITNKTNKIIIIIYILRAIVYTVYNIVY